MDKSISVVILIFVAIIFFLIHRSFPSQKLKRAKKFYSNRKYSKAIPILESIFSKHKSAPIELAKCKYRLGQLAINKEKKLRLFNEVLSVGKRLKKIPIGSYYLEIEAYAFLEMAKVNYSDSFGSIEKLKQNIQFIEEAKKNGIEDKFKELKEEHLVALWKIYYEKACEYEKSGDFQKAIKLYHEVKIHGDSHMHRDAVERIHICKIKNNEKFSKEDLQKAHFEIRGTETGKSPKKDFFYRYTLSLLKREKFFRADKTLTQYFNSSSKDVEKLKANINAGKNNFVFNYLNEINIFIDNLYSKEIPTKELEKFYSSLEKNISKIAEVNTQLSQKIENIKPTIFSRLLDRYFSNKQFGEAISLIHKYPKFWENAGILKNLGICCYGLVSKGLLDNENYRTVISGWLTAVFSDKVILNSLEETVWDDNYTFTLVESIGSNYMLHDEIPENVNYDEISETNISIGATQKELLQQFENLIHKEIQDPSLSKIVNAFYDEEKQSIEEIILNIADDIFFATPHFSKTFDINNDIIKSLDKDYYNFSNESVLEAGIPYIKNSNSTVVYQYFFANNLIEKVVSAIKDIDANLIKKINNPENMQWINKFEGVKYTLEDNLYNAISKKVLEDEENEKMISVMEECINFSPQNDKLKYQYSNYVANLCVRKVNGKVMDYFNALSLLKGAYMHSPDNQRIIRDFVTLIKFNLMDILQNTTRKSKEIFSILEWVKNNKSQAFIDNSYELSKTGKEILQQFKDAGVNVSLLQPDGFKPLPNPAKHLLDLIAESQNQGEHLTEEGKIAKRVLFFFNALGSEPIFPAPKQNRFGWESSY